MDSSFKKQEEHQKGFQTWMKVKVGIFQVERQHQMYKRWIYLKKTKRP
jgi:hypothetical protein